MIRSTIGAFAAALTLAFVAGAEAQPGAKDYKAACAACVMPCADCMKSCDACT